MKKKTKNVTVAVSESTYRRLRIWAAERNTSLSAVVQAFLTDLPNLRELPVFPKPGARRLRPRRTTHVVLDLEFRPTSGSRVASAFDASSGETVTEYRANPSGASDPATP